MKRSCHFLASIILVLVSSTGWAWPPIFGPELEFNHPDSGRASANHADSPNNPNQKWAEKLAKRMREVCPLLKCTVFSVEGKWNDEWRVQFEDGFFFQIGWDPTVVEVTAQPLSLEQFRQQEDRMANVLYKNAREIGLSTLVGGGAGHVNVGAQSVFAEDPSLILKFYVDFANHPELALGILNNDTFNAPPLSEYANDQKQALVDIIQKFRLGQYTSYIPIAQDIQTKVHTSTTLFDEPGGAGHYQALSVKTIAGTYLADGEEWYEPLPLHQQRIEVRTAYAQSNFTQFILFSELMQKRLEFLRNSTGPTIYNKNSTHWMDISNQHAVDLFWVYLTEMNESYEKYLPLLVKPYSKFKPNAIFQRPPKWEDPSYREELLIWLPEVFHSKWVHNHLIELLQSPEAHKHEMTKLVDKALNSYLKAQQLADPEAIKQVQDFISEIQKTAAVVETKKSKFLFCRGIHL